MAARKTGNTRKTGKTGKTGTARSSRTGRRPRRAPHKVEFAETLKRAAARRIKAILADPDRGLTQTSAAPLMHTAPSQISLIVNGKLTGFSVERLFDMLTSLGDSITVEITPQWNPKSRARGEMRVRAPK